MNKENQFYQNEISTGIHDSCSKTYSSRFIQTQKRNLFQKKILPSKYQKAVVTIQRYWRFRQHMKRRVCQKIINDLDQTNECYELQNKILTNLMQQYERIVSFKQKIIQTSIKQSCSQYQAYISVIKKQCVMTSFKLQKKNPTKQLLSQLINKKEEQRELNLMLNRQKLIVQEDLQQQKKQHQMLLQQFKRLNLQHLQLVREKNNLSHKNAQRMLQTSKFGSKQGINKQKRYQQNKTFIIDFLQN